jgi:hypothetical protein
MLQAAQAWKQITRERPAALAVAEALVQLEQGENAITQLRPYIDAARLDPAAESSVEVLNYYGRALVLAKQSQRAFDELSPLLAKSSLLRTGFWYPVAGSMVEPEDRARQWIDAARTVTADTANEQIALASALTGLGQRYPASAVTSFEQAERILSATANKPDAAARVLESLGYIRQLRGDAKNAEVAYREAMKRDAKSYFALRGLGEILTQTNPTEAVEMITKAIALAGPGDLTSQLILGNAHQQLAIARQSAGDTTGVTFHAGKSLEAYRYVLDRDNVNVQAMLGAVVSLDLAGKVADSFPIYENLLGASVLPPNVKRAYIQNNFADALLRAGTGRSDFERARNLARSALEGARFAPTFDTLGAAELACGDIEASIKAYRDALALDKNFSSSAIGLVDALSRGSEAQKGEARQFVQQMQSSEASLSADLKAKLQKVRERLAQ